MNTAIPPAKTENNMKKKPFIRTQDKMLLATLLISILALLISLATLVLSLFLYWNGKSQAEPTAVSALATTDSQTIPANATTSVSNILSEATTTATTVTSATTATTTTVTTEPPITICTELSDILESNGYTMQDLGDSKQLIAAISDGCSCTVYGFSEIDHNWTMDFVTNGCVGKNGVSAESREGDYRTPKGLFPLGFAFGTENLTDLSIPYRQLNENCYWVDDPESAYYNQWQETTNVTWNSAEHLIDYATSYRYTVVVNYNMNPIVPYAGSAIFLHCATGSYTAGCIGVPTSDMRNILYWLDEKSSPLILTS